MALEFPKELEKLQTGKIVPEAKELTGYEREIADLSKEILAGNEKAQENLLTDEMLNPSLKEKKIEKLQDVQRDVLRVIERVRDAIPDNYNIEEIEKAA